MTQQSTPISATPLKLPFAPFAASREPRIGSVQSRNQSSRAAAKDAKTQGRKYIPYPSSGDRTPSPGFCITWV